MDEIISENMDQSDHMSTFDSVFSSILGGVIVLLIVAYIVEKAIGGQNFERKAIQWVALSAIGSLVTTNVLKLFEIRHGVLAVTIAVSGIILYLIRDK